jgi:hypothetical protein
LGVDNQASASGGVFYFILFLFYFKYLTNFRAFFTPLSATIKSLKALKEAIIGYGSLRTPFFFIKKTTLFCLREWSFFALYLLHISPMAGAGRPPGICALLANPGQSLGFIRLPGQLAFLAYIHKSAGAVRN